MSTVTFTHPVREAKQIGTQQGRASASWFEVDSDNAARILTMIDDCDPEFFDAIPNPLSGEWADDYSESDLARDCGIPNDDETSLYSTLDQCIDAFREAFDDAYVNEVSRMAKYHLA